MSNRVITELKSLGSEIKMQAVELPKSVVSNIPKQILGTTGQQQNNPVVKPPTDQEVVDQLYGANEKPALNQEQISVQANEKAISEARKKEKIRQALKSIQQQGLSQREPTPEEKEKMEEEKQKEAVVEQQKDQIPELIEPSAARKKGLFGATGKRKKGQKQQISDLQTGAERKMPGSGIA